MLQVGGVKCFCLLMSLVLRPSINAAQIFCDLPPLFLQAVVSFVNTALRCNIHFCHCALSFLDITGCHHEVLASTLRLGPSQHGLGRYPQRQDRPPV